MAKLTPPNHVVSEYLLRLAQLAPKVDPITISLVLAKLQEVRTNGGIVYIMGNGGSAATASHWATDLFKAGVRAISLSANSAMLTALLNDRGYRYVFAAQLEAMAHVGDAAVMISASGNSPSVLHAVDTARKTGIPTIGLVGFDGGALKGMVDLALWVRSEVGAYGLVEDCHSAICHALAAALMVETDSSSRALP